MTSETLSQARSIILDTNDNVAVVLEDVSEGRSIDSGSVRAGARIPPGHKIAVSRIEKGESIRKYGQIIGFAASPISRGDHVHTHNVEVLNFDRTGSGLPAPEMGHFPTPATFDGIRRSDGRVATRNYLGIVTSVNCSATVAQYIAKAFDRTVLADFPAVDGVVALTHGIGCCVGADESLTQLRRTIGGLAAHPNFASVLIVGLGCETNQISGVLEERQLSASDRLRTMTIQDKGGTVAAVEAGCAIIREMLPAANAVTRKPVIAGELMLGLECGGSDGYSGITANPALGVASDLLVRHGGTSILSETPEIYGAEHLLTSRAHTPAVAKKLMELILWWEEYAALHGGSIDNNPTHGNKAGGLTTIYEKSLGAAAKGGTSRLMDVYRYAEPITSKGFVFMDSPGYDPMSITGQVASGANIVAFTTGRGSCYGCKPVPTVKLATNTPMFERMKDDMDINCGQIVDGEKTVESMGEEIFQELLAVASGKKTKSEIHGFGDHEFVPWTFGAQY